MPDLEELNREKLTLEERRLKAYRKVNDLRTRGERFSKESGDLIYLESLIKEVDAKIAEETNRQNEPTK